METLKYTLIKLKFELYNFYKIVFEKNSTKIRGTLLYLGEHMTLTNQDPPRMFKGNGHRK